jgi:RimJ/RimL family protein N-acetyltransferase
VMHDYGGPIGRSDSDAKLDGYMAAWREHGFSRWAIETHTGSFLGYAGGMLAAPITRSVRMSIGWRLVRHGWDFGYATEAARAALTDVFDPIRLDAVIAYTSPDNLRSQAVMARLQMRRDPSRDFKAWRGLVWEAGRTELKLWCRRYSRRV